MKLNLTPLFAALLLAGCASVGSVGPSQLPQAPAAYKAQAANGASALTASWWQPFADPVLDDLVGRAMAANTSVQAAASRLAQARAALGTAQAARLPQVGVSAGAGRSSTPGQLLPQPATQYSAGLNLAYELDLGGRLLHERNAAALDVQAREQLLADARLLVQANVARGYLALRALDTERDIVRDTVAAYGETLTLTEKRARAGDVADLDLARVRAELAANEAEALALDRRRIELETALAVLVGEPASSFSLAPANWATALPAVPAGLPSELLQRRPDLAAARSQVEAAQARVGEARAAWWPSLQLTAQGGGVSNELSRLLKSGAGTWGVGLLGALPIFDGGRREAGVNAAQAQLDGETIALREQFLLALKDVEDQLGALALLQAQAEASARAVSAAGQALKLSDTRYRNGFISQLELLDARRTELANKRAALQVRSAQYQATVGLIRALGGGWSSPGA
ncbi:efflux transporter outer membrane subunit [Roseateles saccharophilus]|uniref:Multidrug efflux system outer membrane protein n=1 Tax=Roseateles saccharophilus TaxID=304 RepID=A0A4R3UYL4_ROSSA|nr:efflux transporter outer membrane subunit [Roseateles saccharophilus]MDG0831891.1 efflux transporter outer membrane subunit [Roseateles saccharophilus]TCU97446.1 multidrug efflux system outer membrane protein [Roseateles saccharophilus]